VGIGIDSPFEFSLGIGVVLLNLRVDKGHGRHSGAGGVGGDFHEWSCASVVQVNFFFNSGESSAVFLLDLLGADDLIVLLEAGVEGALLSINTTEGLGSMVVEIVDKFCDFSSGSESELFVRSVENSQMKTKEHRRKFVQI
jgi:hypothetical protein